MSNANIGQNDALADSKVNTSQTTKQRPRGPQNKDPANHKGNEPEATKVMSPKPPTRHTAIGITPTPIEAKQAYGYRQIHENTDFRSAWLALSMVLFSSDFR